jgi:hypothetical protein
MILTLMQRTIQFTLLLVWLSAIGRVVHDFLTRGYMNTSDLAYLLAGLGLGLLAPRLLEIPHVGAEKLPPLPTPAQVMEPPPQQVPVPVPESASESASLQYPYQSPRYTLWDQVQSKAWVYIVMAVPAMFGVVIFWFWTMGP